MKKVCAFCISLAAYPRHLKGASEFAALRRLAANRDLIH
jgi:hypothetical protein